MGKHSKNGAGSGGDERNMYYRRYKSTSTSSKASTNENLAKGVTDLESSSRPKNSGSTSQQYTVPAKSNTKSKLRSPVKVGLGQPTNRANKPIADNKEIKKPTGASKAKSQLTVMKQESPIAEQISVNMQPDNKEMVEQNDTRMMKESIPANQENGDSSNGMYNNGAFMEANLNENKNGQTDQNGQEGIDSNEKAEEFNLHLEVDENCFAFEEMLEVPTHITTDEATEKELADLIEEIKDDSKLDTESYSVDVVESTTSEMSEATESSQSSEIKEKNEENGSTSEAMKDENVEDNSAKSSQSEEETKADQSSSNPRKDTTFGKTLRTISGRHSIGRMRHNMVLRDRQSSPNSSLFVNTSRASTAEDGDLKDIQRHTPTSELTSTNGTEKLFDRKRKLIEETFNTPKKTKTEEKQSSFLNSSIEMLKKPFRRSTKVLTPAKSEKEQIHVGGGELVKYGEPGSRKWCLIM